MRIIWGLNIGVVSAERIVIEDMLQIGEVDSITNCLTGRKRPWMGFLMKLPAVPLGRDGVSQRNCAEANPPSLFELQRGSPHHSSL